jgi:hypothetical protein
LEDDAQHGRAVEVVVVLSWACGGEAKGKTEVTLPRRQSFAQDEDV